MSQKRDLFDAIDDTAVKLLQKINGDHNLPDKDIFVEQVKAFDAVVKWSQVRNSIAPKEATENKFAGIKRDAVAALGSKARNRGGAGQAPPKASSVIAFPRAEDDDGDADPAASSAGSDSED